MGNGDGASCTRALTDVRDGEVEDEDVPGAPELLPSRHGPDDEAVAQEGDQDEDGVGHGRRGEPGLAQRPVRPVHQHQVVVGVAPAAAAATPDAACRVGLVNYYMEHVPRRQNTG